MQTTYIKVALVSWLALLLTACSQVLTPTLTHDTTPAPAIIQHVVETPTSSVIYLHATEAEEIMLQMTQTALLPISSNLESLIGKAKQDLAHKLEISIDNVKVVTIIDQEFSANAFYCLDTKERITKEDSPQVLLGQSILLSASGRRYEYHGSDQVVIFCRPLP